MRSHPKDPTHVAAHSSALSYRSVSPRHSARSALSAAASIGRRWSPPLSPCSVCSRSISRRTNANCGGRGVVGSTLPLCTCRFRTAERYALIVEALRPSSARDETKRHNVGSLVGIGERETLSQSPDMPSAPTSTLYASRRPDRGSCIADERLLTWRSPDGVRCRQFVERRQDFLRKLFQFQPLSLQHT